MFDEAVSRLCARPGERVFGDETADEATGRFGAVADALLAAHPSGDVVLVTHGTVIALFVARRAGVAMLPLWRRLGFPSVVLLTRPRPRLDEVVDAVS